MIRKHRTVENLYLELTVGVAQFLNRLKLDLAHRIPRELTAHVYFFKILQFLQENKNNITYHGRDQFRIPEIDHLFSIKGASLLALSEYFERKKTIPIFKRGRDVYATVQEFVFLLPFPHGIFELDEVFYKDCYGGFDVSNQTVVDVGAFIGDTSIYFASNEARKVIAFEPVPSLCNIARKNIIMNEFADVVCIHNEAVGDKRGETIIYENTNWPGRSSKAPTISSKGHKVPMFPLSEIILDADNVGLLKMDCEGCEHIALDDACKKGALTNVDNVIVEVHYDVCHVLSVLRKADFEVKVKNRSIDTALLFASRT